MDWTKAKSILIVALIVTNLVLIATYFFQINDLEDDEEEMQAVTIKLLEQKNIFLNTDIPKERPRMAKLTVQYDKMNKSDVKGQLEKQRALPESQLTDEKAVSITQDFITKCGLMTENVTFDCIVRSESGIIVRYKNTISGTAIEDSEIICTIRDGKIVDFERFWLKPVELNDIEKEVISADTALIKYMSEKTEEEIVYIKGISLVYWLDSSVFDAESAVTDTAFPAWKITYNNNKVKYIMAWEQ